MPGIAEFRESANFRLDLATDNGLLLSESCIINNSELSFMNMTQAPVERRLQPRFKAAEGVFAALVNHNSKLGQIRDISKMGLAFRYIDNGDEPGEASELKIIVGMGGVYLEKLPFRKVNDFEIQNEYSFSSLKMRQMGLQFGGLTRKQCTRLEHFIQKHTTGEA
jgi:hypothetical protein